VITVSSRRQEVEIICKLIKDLAGGDPERELSSICVALHHPQEYTDLFREECARFGIPANITDRFELARSPLTTMLLGLLRMQVGGFRREDVLRVAGAPYFRPESGSSPIDAANLAEVSSELRIIGGYEAWLSRIRRRREEDRRSTAAAAPSAERARRERSARAMDRAESDLQALGALTRELAGECAPAEFHRRFIRMLERLGVARNLVALRGDGAAAVIERDVRAYAKFLEVLRETMELLAFQDGPQAAHTLKDYADQLRAAILRERYNVREQFGRGVLITSIDETRGLSMDVMIVAGLVDGEFPSVYQPEVFLSSERRLVREQRFIWQNRYLFYQAVTNWVSHLYLTIPKREGEIDLVRSSFVDALLKVARVEEWRSGENVPFEQTLAAEDEVLAWYGAGDEAVPDGAGLPVGFSEKLSETRHAAGVERSRTVLHNLPDYEGLLAEAVSEDARRLLANLRSDVFSVTQLEAYGQCPFRFFAARLLNLDAPQDFGEGLTPIEKGSILHEALFEFFTLRRGEGLPPLSRCGEEQFEAAVTDLTRIVDMKMSALEIPDAFWALDRELLLGSSTGGRGLVREFLEAERKRSVQSIPLYFEVAFGGTDAAADSILSTPEPVRLGGIRLRGKVDRVEVGDGFFSIVDYKTGAKLPGMDDIRSGMSLQLALYLRATEQLLESAHRIHLQPAAGLYYRLRSPVKVTAGLADGAYDKIAFASSANSRHVLRSRPEFEEVLNGAVRLAEASVAAMAEGRFPLTAPENIEKVCTYCDFKTICRIQTVRHIHPTTPEEP
jgi:ATP-dependent helicase/nuclease subunit B